MIRQTCWDYAGIKVERGQPLLRHFRADRGVAAMRFPVGNVVEQGSQFDDEQIGRFGLADSLGHFPDPVNVPPVVAAAVAREDSSDVVGGAVDQVGGRHATVYLSSYAVSSSYAIR